MSLVINGQVIPEQALDDELLRLSAGLEMDAPHAGALNPEHLRSAALRNLVTRTLLLQAAAAHGLSVSNAEIHAERERTSGSRITTVSGSGVHNAMAQDLLIQKVGTHLTRHVQRPGRDETQALYLRDRSSFFLPEAVRAAHIVRNITSESEEATARETLELAEAELARGRPFAQVADRYSDCKGVGGSVGWVTRQQMVPEFEEIVFALDPGKRSSIFRTIFGLHIATITGRRQPGYRPFEDVRSELAASILAERRQAMLAQIVATMERASDIHFAAEDTHA